MILKPISPVTGKRNTKLIRTINTSSIIQKYKINLNINVAKYFNNLKKIEIYECLDSSYRFYYPFNIVGDSALYEDLAKKPWYYDPWKWEHEIASKEIENNSRVLEVGCGNGTFLHRMTQKNCKCVGLELSTNQVLAFDNLKILNQSILKHSFSNRNIYDYVCLFQTLEHIANVKKVLSR